MNNSTTLISVIVPIYKSEKYLRCCLDSIINQTYKNIEILLIDDGSPDNSGKICDEYAKIDNRINVIHTINRGVSAARNTGITVSKGEYISFIDSDDYIDTDFYELLINKAREKNPDIIYCDSFNVDSNNNILNKKTDRNLTRYFSQKEALINCLKSENGFRLRIMNAIYKRKVVLPFTEGRVYAEDQEFIVKAYLQSELIAFVYSSKYYYRLHPSVAKSLKSSITINNQKEAIKMVKNILTNAKCDEDILSAFYTRCMLVDFINIDCYCNDDNRDKALFKPLIRQLRQDLIRSYSGLQGKILALILTLPEPIYVLFFRLKKKLRKW